jgi:hypothetical protein
MAPLRVRGYTHEDALHWDRFVELCPDATFFHRLPMPVANFLGPHLVKSLG